jgi:carbon-monoxide dehydrogenase medium subunit
VIQELNYYLPTNLNDAYSHLNDDHQKAIAGATDIIPRLRRTKLPIDVVVDISRLEELDFIQQRDQEIQIGALTTHADLAGSRLLQANTSSLVEAALSIGCPQTRNRGTLGGNIANASPAADTLPPLLTYDAFVHVGAADGQRAVPLGNFLLGPGKTDLSANELIEFVSFQAIPNYTTAFVKLGKRNGMSISIASAAVAFTLDEAGKIRDARVALGSVAPTAVRSPHAEEVLNGKLPETSTFNAAGKAVVKDIAPIDDVRASASYRRTAASALIVQALNLAAGRLKE